MIIIFLYILLPIIQVVIYINSNYAFDFIEALNYITSITSLIWMLSNVLLASKVPLFQKLIPYDKRIKVHIITSIGIILFAIYHGLYKFIIGYSITLAIPYAIFLAIFMILSILWIKKITKNYDINKKIHIYAQPILGIILFYHIYSAELFSDIPLYSSIIYIVMFFLAYGMFLLSKIGVFKYECKVISIRRVEDIHILELEALSPLKYSSGQFAFLSYTNRNGKTEEHPFSFLSEGNAKSIKFGIKILGDFTESLKEIKIGDAISLKGSYGNFRPNFNSKTPITLIGSGIGIVPIISIIKEYKNSGIKRDINVFLAVNSKEELLDIEEYNDMNINYLIYNENKAIFTTEYFKEKISSPMGSEYYLCSSDNVRKIVLDILKSLGVKKSKIKYEAFSF